METDEEYRFRIDAFVPATMPLDRLATYLAELAQMLGEPKSLHLVEIEPGSTVLVHKVDREALPKIRERAIAVRNQIAPADAMVAYRNINRMLREDNGSGVLIEERGVEILVFPGKHEEATPHLAVVEEYAEIDGEVIRVGGTSDPVPILLTIDGETVSHVWARRAVAGKSSFRSSATVRFWTLGAWAGRQMGSQSVFR